MAHPQRKQRLYPGAICSSNENTNGLLRQYFPKGTDLSVHSDADLDRVAAQLNDRPRKRYDYAKPDELIGHLLLPTR